MSSLDFNGSLYQGLPNAIVAKNYAPINVEVVFGAPGKHCHGAGICKVLFVEHVRVHCKCPSARAWLGAAEDGSILLTFDRSVLSSDLCERYFGGGVFLVEEAYPFPEMLLSLINLRSFTVKPGLYTVKVSEYFLVVCF